MVPQKKQASLPAVLLFEDVVGVFLLPLMYFWLNVAATVVWLSSLLPPSLLLLYVESPCGPLSSMAVSDELGEKCKPHYFSGLKPALVLVHTLSGGPMFYSQVISVR